MATSALGAGIDIPDVRLVVYVRLPQSLRDFVQESGRAGRDSQVSRSVVVVSAAWLRQPQQPQQPRQP